MENSLLFGNGINLLDKDSVSWIDLLKDISLKDKTFFKELPNTINYEKIFLDRCTHFSKELLSDEYKIKKEIAEKMAQQESSDFYKEILDINFNHYLTTNYDDAFVKSTSLKKSEDATEEIYSIRRKFKGNDFSLWKIHGCIRNPKSIMLGLDHYCGSVSKIDSYVKGSYKYKKQKNEIFIEKMTDKILSDNYCNTSWVDLFFHTNMHILGLGLDYTETDIWWVLNKRARLKIEYNITNNIYYHCSNIEDDKKELLNSVGVDVIEHKRSGDEPEDFIKAHAKSIVSIREILKGQLDLAA